MGSIVLWVITTLILILSDIVGLLHIDSNMDQFGVTGHGASLILASAMISAIISAVSLAVTYILFSMVDPNRIYPWVFLIVYSLVGIGGLWLADYLAELISIYSVTWCHYPFVGIIIGLIRGGPLYFMTSIFR